jgi:hypothetical protein
LAAGGAGPAGRRASACCTVLLRSPPEEGLAALCEPLFYYPYTVVMLRVPRAGHKRAATARRLRWAPARRARRA